MSNNINAGTRFVDPAWGFAMGWNYALNYLITLPIELSAIAVVIQYWFTGFDSAVFITIGFAITIFINLMSVRQYGNAEVLISGLKVLSIIGFFFCAICINTGATPAGVYFGAKTWSNPGAFNNGFPGLCSCFVNAGFAFSGVELAGLAAGETVNPRKTVPKAAKQVHKVNAHARRE